MRKFIVGNINVTCDYEASSLDAMDLTRYVLSHGYTKKIKSINVHAVNDDGIGNRHDLTVIFDDGTSKSIDHSMLMYVGGRGIKMHNKEVINEKLKTPEYMYVGGTKCTTR